VGELLEGGAHDVVEQRLAGRLVDADGEVVLAPEQELRRLAGGQGVIEAGHRHRSRDRQDPRQALGDRR
jgi:hypothetical protein